MKTQITVTPILKGEEAEDVLKEVKEEITQEQIKTIKENSKKLIEYYSRFREFYY